VRKSIHIYDSLKEPSKSADNYMELEVMYSKQKKYTEALRYGYIVDSIYKAQNDTSRFEDNMVNLAVIYKNMGEYDNAIHIYQTYLKKYGIDPFSQLVVHHNMAVALGEKGEYDEAQKHFLIAAGINNVFFKEAYFDVTNNKEIARFNLKA